MPNMLTQTYEGLEGYDTMQVCMNGHQITSYAATQPEVRQTYCSGCGAKTIDRCQNCSTPIRGYRHMPGVFLVASTPVPKHCINCGQPYPWQEAAIENLTDLLKESGLSDDQIAEAEKALPDVIQETPKTESASLKLGKVLRAMGKPAYDITIKVVSDLASETAKKTLGLG